jgi:TetR/AcrR family transcriptional regulator, cholesterol catabolism regulator
LAGKSTSMRKASAAATGATDGVAAIDGQAPDTRTRIVSAAAALFREQGYAASSMRELAAVIGIQKASLYYHVSSKEELLFEICSDSLTRITEQVTTVGRDASPETRLRAMCERHLVSALEDRDHHAVMLAEMRGLSDSHRKKIIKLRDAYERVLYEAIVEDRAAGRIRGDIDAKYLTLGLLNLMNWTVFWFKPDDDKSPEDLAEVFTTLFLEGAHAR